MNGYITKPVSIKAIADAIANIASSGNAPAPKDKANISSANVKDQLHTGDNGLQCCHSRESGNPVLNFSGFPIGSGMTEKVQPQVVVFDSKSFSNRLRGRSALISKIINITLDETPKTMRELEQAVIKREQDTAWRLSHNIRGGAANVSASQFLAVAVKVETDCKACEWHEVENLLPELNRQFAILERAMRKFQKTLN